jgi:hypothetical protein
MWPVSQRVNSVNNDTQLLERVPENRGRDGRGRAGERGRRGRGGELRMNATWSMVADSLTESEVHDVAVATRYAATT